MARTPLLSRFQRLVADFQEAGKTGKTVGQVQADRRNGLSRREFLKVGGATLGAAAVAGHLPASWGPASRASTRR
jgi:hypothetical protein